MIFENKDVRVSKNMQSAAGNCIVVNRASLQTMENRPSMKYARVKLNTEHGKYGKVFFPMDCVRDTTKPDVKVVVLDNKEKYMVYFERQQKGNRKYIKLTGREIVDKSHTCTIQSVAKLTGKNLVDCNRAYARYVEKLLGENNINSRSIKEKCEKRMQELENLQIGDTRYVVKESCQKEM